MTRTDDSGVKNRPSMSQDWHLKGKEFYREARYDDALRCYDKALKLDSEAAELWNDKGDALLTNGAPEKAVFCFEKATQLNEHYVEAWSNLAAALLLTGAYQRALASLDKVLELEPHNKRALRDKGGLLFALAKYEHAVEFYNKLLELRPSPEILAKRDEALAHLRRAELPPRELQKKICMLGDPAVGKTSLVRRYVLGGYDEKYVSTIGANITKKVMRVRQEPPIPDIMLTLQLWDIAGQRTFGYMQNTYFRGTQGAFIVCDLTRKETLDSMLNWVDALYAVSPDIPILLLGNKTDLKEQMVVKPEALGRVAAMLAASYVLTSAKTGDGVERGFALLTRKLLDDTQSAQVNR